MSPTQKQLETLSTVAKTLNKKSDKLNSAIADLEKRIAETNIGVSVWLDYRFELRESSGLDEEGHLTWLDYHQLGYTKVGSDWCICVRARSDQYDAKRDCTRCLETEAPVRLSSAPRSIRCEAAAHFDELVDSIIRKAQAYIENIDHAEDLLK